MVRLVSALLLAFFAGSTSQFVFWTAVFTRQHIAWIGLIGSFLFGYAAFKLLSKQQASVSVTVDLPKPVRVSETNVEVVKT
jgi:hypothetical protein